MYHPCKMLTLFMFALIATILIPSSTQAFPTDQLAFASDPESQNNHPLSPQYYPFSSYADGFFPELSQYYSDEQDMAPENQYSSPPLAPYATGIDYDYPYVENSSPPPSPPPYVDVEGDNDEFQYSPSEAATPADDEFRYSPSEAPTPAELNDTPAADMTLSPQVHAAPPVLPFNYNVEDDSSEFSSEDFDEEGYGEGKKKNRAAIGFVMGAVCLVGLGGLSVNTQCTCNCLKEGTTSFEIATCSAMQLLCSTAHCTH